MKYRALFKEIPITPYAVELWLIITNDPYKSCAEFNQKHKDLGLKWGSGTAASTEDVFYKDSFLTVVFDSKQIDFDTIAHEVTHIKNMVMVHAGIKHDFNNDEPEAYLVGWLVGEIVKALNEFKKR